MRSILPCLLRSGWVITLTLSYRWALFCVKLLPACIVLFFKYLYHNPSNCLWSLLLINSSLLSPYRLIIKKWRSFTWHCLPSPFCRSLLDNTSMLTLSTSTAHQIFTTEIAPLTSSSTSPSLHQWVRQLWLKVSATLMAPQDCPSSPPCPRPVRQHTKMSSTLKRWHCPTHNSPSTWLMIVQWPGVIWKCPWTPLLWIAEAVLPTPTSAFLSTLQQTHRTGPVTTLTTWTVPCVKLWLAKVSFISLFLCCWIIIHNHKSFINMITSLWLNVGPIVRTLWCMK